MTRLADIRQSIEDDTQRYRVQDDLPWLLDLVERAVPYMEILRDNQFDGVSDWLKEVKG